MTALPVLATAGARVFTGPLRVAEHEAVNADYRLMRLEAPPTLTAACAPGQFFHLLCPAEGRHAPLLRRPMSIYGAEGDRLSFLYKVQGKGTAALATLPVGGSLEVMGPLGQGFRLDPGWRNLLLVARGVGLATLAPLAAAAKAKGMGLTAICSARAPEFLMSLELFASHGAEVVTVLDSDGTSAVEHLDPMIEARMAAGAVDAVFTCGSARLLRLLQALGDKHGVPGQVALEQQMACGLGMCHCCVRPFRRDGATVPLRVCREGPVFDIREAVA
ncbi:dihydroorotate dehydrogenase electron transfer subunit [Paracoccus sp. S-4012]|uniref:iron-sulfur cluster-binding protein n=1 Tax=Paracoccus sp. S-4012 TaxID=2665648 RepID=UPI0012AF3100|nr:dihydroorotate dehydrogenase electron transfer subunit [Paracoccus sp. S-4012]MRX50150.1 dihydroorotate dehydrogenase electron transfer subunit [Paracoccus sp. S-4012]